MGPQEPRTDTRGGRFLEGDPRKTGHEPGETPQGREPSLCLGCSHGGGGAVQGCSFSKIGRTS